MCLWLFYKSNIDDYEMSENMYVFKIMHQA